MKERKFPEILISKQIIFNEIQTTFLIALKKIFFVGNFGTENSKIGSDLKVALRWKIS